MTIEEQQMLAFFAQRDAFLMMLLGVLVLLGAWAAYMFNKYERFVDETKQRDRFRQFMSGTGEFKKKTDGD